MTWDAWSCKVMRLVGDYAVGLMDRDRYHCLMVRQQQIALNHESWGWER